MGVGVDMEVGVGSTGSLRVIIVGGTEEIVCDSEEGE